MTAKEARHKAGVLQRLIVRDLRQIKEMGWLADVVKDAESSCRTMKTLDYARDESGELTSQKIEGSVEVLTLRPATAVDRLALEQGRTMVTESLANVLHPSRPMLAVEIQP